MSLQRLDIYNVRNIVKASLAPSPGLNFIYGDNGSGKSSLLEAIFILGRARSFRTTHIKQVINFAQRQLIVSGRSLQKNGAVFQLGIMADGKELEIRINQAAQQPRHLLAYTLPIQLIDPKSYRLLDAAPPIRREFIDWGVFNDNERFLPIWRNYKKVLGQRNALLKTRSARHVEVWDKELVNYGTIIDELRKDYVNRLEPVFIEIIRQFIPFESIKLKVLSGWDPTKGFIQSVRDDIDKDIRYGYTHSGPHRCDLQLMVNDRLAKDYVSRGQLKLLVLGLKLAQVKLLTVELGNVGCILIDDFTAELDVSNRSKLLEYLSGLRYQAFITATESKEFGDIDNNSEYRVFHVEQNQVKQV